MKNTKIIHYSGFINKKVKPPNHPKPNEDQFYFASWAGLIARKIKARAPEMDIEVWSADRDFEKVSSRIVDGIKASVFPYRFPVLVPGSLTLQMFMRLRKLSRNHNLILHTHSFFNFFIVVVAFFVPKIKIVFSHHGGRIPNRKSIKGKLKSFIVDPALKKVSFGTYQNKITKDYLTNIIPKKNLSFLPVGADFNLFKGINKTTARKKLNLSVSIIYGIYIGNLYRLKGVDIIMDAYDNLKEKYDFKVLFIGSVCEDEMDLYNRIKHSDCIFYGHIDHKEIPLYLSVADFYLHPVFDDTVGLDVANVEAMAIGIPVISAKLKYTEMDYTNLGICPETPKDFLNKVEKMIHSFQEYKKVRETAKKYFDSNTTIPDTYINAYKQIYND